MIIFTNWTIKDTVMHLLYHTSSTAEPIQRVWRKIFFVDSPHFWRLSDIGEAFVETILINPTDLEESLTHILLATRDGTKEALPLNTNYKFKVEHFSNHPTQVFLYKKPRHPMMGLKKHCDNGSPNSIRNPPLPSRETLPKKSSFHKMHAHVPFCSWTGGCFTHSLDWKPGLPSPGRLPWAVTLADQQPWSSYSPQELQKVQHQILINSLKYCLMNLVPELYFLET